MSAAVTRGTRRRFLAPEVVQTSAMDCGPATLKCVLEGFHIPVSYGRLREACQTDVDGTSIDTLEVVANQLGIHATQVLIPSDHVFLPEASPLPAIVVVRHGMGGAVHFVVVWRRVGGWLQVMDPAIGRRWVRTTRFAEEVFRHEAAVPADDWRAWAGTEEFLTPLRERLRQVGMPKPRIDAVIDLALADTGWFSLGALDAGARLVTSLVNAGGTARGDEAARLLVALFDDTRTSTEDIYRLIPRDYWYATPDIEHSVGDTLYLTLAGAVLLRVSERATAPATRADAIAEDTPPLSPELMAALGERPAAPLAAIWQMLREDGLLAPLALACAIVIAVGATVLEASLFRGLFDLAWLLDQPGQRIAAAGALLGFVAILVLFEVPIALESLRLGRHLETRLRVALLRKLPQLSDRYFQSRPVSDMADRSHAIHLARQVPSMGMQFIQAIWKLLLTFIGVLVIDPRALAPAACLALFAVIVPAVVQPLVNERDLRLRNHAGALTGFYLDALLGLVPVRTHSAEQAVRREHEGLLVEWARSALGLQRVGLLVDAVQSVGCLALAAWLLVDHFVRAGGVGGGDLLLVFWTLELPSAAGRITSFAHQYPAQRNVLLRLLEPLSAPEEIAAPVTAPVATTSAARVAIRDGSVLAAGHTILSGLDIDIAPGEHVAVVGVSGAGKSSLAGLLLGWHRLASGELRIDGRVPAAADLERLRQRTAWVDPAIQIWNRPFLDNLTYAADDDALDRVGAAVEAADLRGVLGKLPEGLQTWLGEGGALLSGGEGQRVRLARALLQTDVRLVLLDEPFRGLDRDQRARLLADARQWWHDVTLLCITHDIEETRGFDRVLVIEDGRIVEDDAPARLAQTASRYRALLDAEVLVRRDLWRGSSWRRLRVADGSVRSAA